MRRRTFLRATLGATLAAPLAGAARPHREAARILLIGHKPDHPPGTHLYLQECELLAACLRQTDGVEATVSDGWPRDEATLDGLAALVLYSSPGAELLLAGDHADRAEALLKSGVGLTALHWATGIGDAKNDALAARYLGHLGGLFGFGWSGLDVSESRVRRADPEHPTSRGWDDFDLKDEWYLDLKFHPQARPLAKVRVKDKDQVVAWTFERDGGGRSFGNTLGHFHENFLVDPFRRLIVNGILWTARRDIPEAGAPCALDEAASDPR
jgi:hypothetical protein